MRYDRLDHQFVDEIPEKLIPGQLYISGHYATAVHLCCCGCGHEVVTPFSPAQWQLIFDGEGVSLRPSIGSWSLPCRSHYIIQSGRVIDADQWTEKQAADGQVRDRQLRQAHYAVKDSPVLPSSRPSILPHRKGWLSKVRGFLTASR